MSRSTTGCWTCRIRKKKCDETKPSCTACTLRHLTCHGYGPKPSWMGNPENQKAEIEKLKRAVSQSYRSRRAHINREKSRFLYTRPNIGNLPSDQSESSGRRASDMSASFKATSIEYLLHAHQSALLLSDATSRMTLASSTSACSGSNSAAPLSVLPGDEDRPHETISNPQVEQGIDTLQQSPYEPCSQQHNSTAMQVSDSPEIPMVENEHDFAMIIHYVDYVFPLQYYFYWPAGSELGRGWLLNLLLRSKSSYFVSMAISAAHQILQVRNANITKQRSLLDNLDHYHSLSIGELQRQLDLLPTISGSDHLKLGVEILSCSIQLMTLEVFRDATQYKWDKRDWEVHLNASGVLLSIIGSCLRTPGQCPTPSADELEQPDPNTGQTSKSSDLIPLGEIAGLDLFMVTYIWSDITRRVSIGVRYTDPEPFPYLAYLYEDRIRLEYMMGCQNWVMIIITEISDLEAWKNEMQSRRSLSIPTLCSKGSTLEARLRNGLSNLDRKMIDSENMDKSDKERLLVTEISALSALIYLHIIISGSSHLLPEIRDGVGKALAALKRLPLHLLIRVPWQYCVAACMADSSEKKEFRQITATAESISFIGTVANSREIMEEWWTMRDNLGSKEAKGRTPWALAMESLGIKTLLI